MTQPHEAHGDDRPTAKAAQDRLRAELLTGGLYDLVPPAEVESVITRDDLADTIAEQQQLALSTIRSLVEDGLMEFDGWGDVPLDEAMARVQDLFVNHYDDPGMWAPAVWLKLTNAGKQLANVLQAEARNRKVTEETGKAQ